MSEQSGSIASMTDGLTTQGDAVYSATVGSGSSPISVYGSTIGSSSEPSSVYSATAHSGSQSSSSAVHGVPMFIKIIGGVVLLGMVLLFIKWMINKKYDTFRLHNVNQLALQQPQPLPRQEMNGSGIPLPNAKGKIYVPIATPLPKPTNGGNILTGVSTPSSVMANFPIPIGCYADKSERAMSTWLTSQSPINYVTFETCMQRAKENGHKYFALQDGRQNDSNGTFVGACFASNDITATQQYGKTDNCKAIPGTDKFTGMGYSNYVYGL
jgi:hypothetical protein